MKNDENIIIDDIGICGGIDLSLSFSFSKIKILYLSGNFNKESFSMFNDSCNDKFDWFEELSILIFKNKILFDNIVNNIKNCKNIKKLEIPIEHFNI